MNTTAIRVFTVLAGLFLSACGAADDVQQTSTAPDQIVVAACDASGAYAAYSKAVADEWVARDIWAENVKNAWPNVDGPGVAESFAVLTDAQANETAAYAAYLAEAQACGVVPQPKL